MEMILKQRRLFFLAAGAGMILVIFPIFYLSWIPDPNMRDVSWLPGWIGRWADRYDQFRTAVPMVPLGILAGGWLVLTAAPLLRWLWVWFGLCGMIALVEVGQLLLPRRNFDWMDIAWGAVGAFAGLALVAGFSLGVRIYRKRAKTAKGAQS